MHTHVYKLDPPGQRTSMGRCDCGDEKLHYNVLRWEDTYRNYASKGGQAKARKEAK